MKQQENKKSSMFTRVMAGFLALLMIAGTVFGIIMYFV